VATYRWVATLAMLVIGHAALIDGGHDVQTH